jgi:hypothetical protein
MCRWERRVGRMCDIAPDRSEVEEVHIIQEKGLAATGKPQVLRQRLSR